MPDLDLAYEARRTLRRIRPKILDRIHRGTHPEGESALLIETIDSRLATALAAPL